MRSPAQTSIWLDSGKAEHSSARGRVAILGQGQIVAVTVRMLDADGFVDFSMRKLATELNVTPMAIYWHVDSKNDVLELALDAVHGEFTQQALHPSLQ